MTRTIAIASEARGATNAAISVGNRQSSSDINAMCARIVISLQLIVLVAGCTPTVVDTACQSFGPITYSAKGDTADTVLQVRRHNASWDAICR